MPGIYQKITENIKKAVDAHPARDRSAYNDWLGAVTEWEKEDFTAAHASNRELRNRLTAILTGMMCPPQEAREYDTLCKRSLLFDARHDFDSFLRYVEIDQKPEKQFYRPRAHYLKPLVQGYQDIFDGKIRFLSNSLVKRGGKSQLGILATLFISGKYPDRATLMEGTGDALVGSFFEGLMEYLVPDTEYLFYDVFPAARLKQRNAETRIINLASKSRFPTVMCRSIDARQVGLSEASNLLYLDDCVEGREEAKNRQRLEDKWEIISGDVIGRAVEGTPIIISGTRYSIYDPIGRLQEEARKQHWNWRAVEIPALNSRDESNYAYFNPKMGRVIFTTDFFKGQRDLLSAEQWESEFQQQPFEAHGLLFNRADLNYFIELPTDHDPDARIAVCDTAESGSDSTAMVILYIYGEDVYVVDVVFDNSASYVVKPQCARKLIQHKVSKATFESNSAGEYFSRDVYELVRQQGGRLSLRTKRTISNKQTRIDNAADGIIKHFFFWDWSVLAGEAGRPEDQKMLGGKNGQYWTFMQELTTYVRSGRVPHDDAPDALSLAENELRYIIKKEVPMFMRPC